MFFLTNLLKYFDLFHNYQSEESITKQSRLI